MTLSTVARIAGATAVVGAALLCTGIAIALNQPAEAGLPEVAILDAPVVTAIPDTQGVEIRSTGVVAAQHVVPVQSQVGGRVARVSEHWESGARVARGEVLFWIEATDYELRLVQQRAALRAAELELDLEDQRGRVAERAWTELSAPGEDGRLAKRLPQLETQQANVDSARARVEEAELALRRTAIRAPFDALVTRADAAPGQLLSAGQTVGELVGSAAFEVEVPVRADALALLDLDAGAATAVVQPTPGTRIPARIDGVAGAIDPQTRNPVVRVVVPDPLSHGATAASLLPGAFVEVGLQTPPRPELTRLPVGAIDEGDRVWVAEEGDTLGVREVTVVFRGRRDALVASSLPPRTRVLAEIPRVPVVGSPLAIREVGDVR